MPPKQGPLLIYLRPVIWSLFYSRAASPTTDRLGMPLMLATGSTLSEACLNGRCTETLASCASEASSDLCGPSGPFSFCGAFSQFTISFLTGRQSIGYCVHHMRGCEIPGRLIMWRAVRNTYIRVICVHEIPSTKVLAEFSPKDSVLGAL